MVLFVIPFKYRLDGYDGLERLERYGGLERWDRFYREKRDARGRVPERWAIGHLYNLNFLDAAYSFSSSNIFIFVSKAL